MFCDWGFCLVHPLITFLLTSLRQFFMVWSPYWATGWDCRQKCYKQMWYCSHYCVWDVLWCDFDMLIYRILQVGLWGKLHIDNHDKLMATLGRIHWCLRRMVAVFEWVLFQRSVECFSAQGRRRSRICVCVSLWSSAARPWGCFVKQQIWNNFASLKHW